MKVIINEGGGMFKDMLECAVRDAVNEVLGDIEISMVTRVNNCAIELNFKLREKEVVE